MAQKVDARLHPDARNSTPFPGIVIMAEFAKPSRAAPEASTQPPFPNRRVAEIAAFMVVNKVEEDRDSMQMGKIDQAFELADPRSEHVHAERRLAQGSEQPVHRCRIRCQLGVRAGLIEHLGREIVDAICSRRCAGWRILGSVAVERHRRRAHANRAVASHIEEPTALTAHDADFVITARELAAASVYPMTEKGQEYAF